MKASAVSSVSFVLSVSNGAIHAKGLVFDSAQPLVLDGTDTNTFGNVAAAVPCRSSSLIHPIPNASQSDAAPDLHPPTSTTQK